MESNFSVERSTDFGSYYGIGGTVRNNSGNYLLKTEFLSTVEEYLIMLSDSFFSYLNSPKLNYIETLSLSKTNLNNVDYKGWEDTVFTKLNNYTDDLLNKKIEEIEKDVSSGNFINLINELQKLKSECVKYINECSRNIQLVFKSNEDSEKYRNGKSSEMSSEEKKFFQILIMIINNTNKTLLI